MYLSELQSGDEVQLVDANGRTREAIVGRAKIEKRPMFRISGGHEDATASTTLLQNAETIKVHTRTAGPRSPTSNLATRCSSTTKTRRATSVRPSKRASSRSNGRNAFFRTRTQRRGRLDRFQLRRTPVTEVDVSVELLPQFRTLIASPGWSGSRWLPT